MKILIFTPYAKPNGAEKMLWYLLQNADRSKFRFHVYTYTEGSLLKELPIDVGYTLPYKPKPVKNNPVKKKWLQIKNKFIYWKTGKYPAVVPPYNTKRHIIELHEQFKPDLWYINTIHMGPIAELATQHQIPFVVHFHDMLYLYTYISYKHLDTIIRNAQLLLGCAQCVCDKLKIMGGQKIIALQYECVDTYIQQPAEVTLQKMRKELEISPDSFVWVMPGSIDIRKGTDMITKIAQIMGSKITILCLGTVENGYGYYIEKETAYYNLSNVIITGFKTEDYFEYLALGDGLLLTSREDPFPLVMIEGAAIGLPIVSFNSGGVSEFVQEGMGVVIDSWNVEDMIEAMEKVMKGEVFLDKSVSKKRAAEFDYRLQVKHWENLMTTYFVENQQIKERSVANSVSNVE